MSNKFTSIVYYCLFSKQFYDHCTVHSTAILQPFYRNLQIILLPFYCHIYEHLITILLLIPQPILPPFYNHFTAILQLILLLFYNVMSFYCLFNCLFHNEFYGYSTEYSTVMLHVLLLPFYSNSTAHSFAILQPFYRNSITHSTAILLPFYCICTAYSTTKSTATLQLILLPFYNHYIVHFTAYSTTNSTAILKILQADSTAISTNNLITILLEWQ